ncbi:MAG: hypothetical protein LBH43_11215 [Treponema sp.]|jgi:predicted RNA-binding Zn-ribbon protein involved in translation (DUF1610 family)|nr:hypothetical protein [Treponema sp.]
MSEQTLKELLKPKFAWAGTRLCNNGKALLELLCDDPIFDDNSFYHKFIDFTAAAMNEKCERDFGEPMRWIDITDEFVNPTLKHLKCPKCGRNEINKYNFCPQCGQRLGQPDEGVKE